MPEEYTRQSIIDEEHLKLLSMGYKISAAVSAFYSFFGLFYVLMGAVIGTIISRTQDSANKPPAFFGWIFAAVGLTIFFGGMAIAALKLRAAICIQKRKSRTFCNVVAAIGCLAVPYGTILGVFSFVVLGRASIVRMFSANTVSTPAA